MAIHYNGEVQRTPGRVSCGSPRAVATVQQWHAATCGQCMVKGLMGLRIVHVDPGSIPGQIVNVNRYEVGARFLDDEPAPTAIKMIRLDSGDWAPYQEAPEPFDDDDEGEQ